MTNDQIKQIMLANGFALKLQGEDANGDGVYDLHPYVYDAARALLAAYQGEPVAEITYTGYEPANAIHWLNKGLAYMEPGTKLYAERPAPITEPVAKPKDCPHADPFRYCAQCPVSPCPVGLGGE